MLSSLSTIYKQQPLVTEPVIDLGPDANGFTKFGFTIVGADYIGSNSTYPIQFNPTDNRTTYADITNFTKTNVQNQNVTIYVKGNWNYYAGLTHSLILFNNGNYGNNTDWFRITDAGTDTNLGKAVSVGFKTSGTTIIDIQTDNVLNPFNEIFHTFIRFNTSTSKIHYNIYNSAGTNVLNFNDRSYTPATVMTNFTDYTFARTQFSNSYASITIHKAGFYDRTLTTTEMQDYVNADPN